LCSLIELQSVLFINDKHGDSGGLSTYPFAIYLYESKENKRRINHTLVRSYTQVYNKDPSAFLILLYNSLQLVA